jgi:K+-sensing histidine kinase KdpD
MPEENKGGWMASHGTASVIVLWVGIVALTLGIGSIDYVTGYEFNFFVFYFIPISITAWYLGMVPAVAMSLVSVTIWYVADFYARHRYSTYLFAIWNTIILLVSFLVIGWVIAWLRELLNKERQVRQKLEKAISEVKVLEGILPICASCKKIRNDKGEWQQIEQYIRLRTNTEFTHGLCPAMRTEAPA